jgi:hypothetical protein
MKHSYPGSSTHSSTTSRKRRSVTPLPVRLAPLADAVKTCDHINAICLNSSTEHLVGRKEQR